MRKNETENKVFEAVKPSKPVGGIDLNAIWLKPILCFAIALQCTTAGMCKERADGILDSGDVLIADTDNGTIKISAGENHERSYTWDGDTRSVILKQRDEPWYGVLGLYFPGEGEHWSSHKGITRGVLEEGRINFKSEMEAIKWLNKTPHRVRKFWTNNGLVVWFDKDLHRHQIGVDVIQITIKKKRPKSLPGSSDERIVLQSPNSR